MEVQGADPWNREELRAQDLAVCREEEEVGPERAPPLPKVVLRWKDEQDQARKQDFTSGYALKMIFGEAIEARIPGKIFLSLPDEGKSFVAGSFEAEIRKAPPPKPKAP